METERNTSIGGEDCLRHKYAMAKMLDFSMSKTYFSTLCLPEREKVHCSKPGHAQLS